MKYSDCDASKFLFQISFPGIFCGTFHVVFQLLNFAIGNFSFQIPITIVSCLWLFDDNIYKFFFSSDVINELNQ